MVIGDRLRALREGKNLSQGQIERQTGLLSGFVSRLEHGDTVPSVEVLEKIAQALAVPLYRLFYDDDEPPKLTNLPNRRSAEDIAGRNRD